MNYYIGQALIWYRDNNYDPPEPVTVEALRKGGCAKLSNGWVVDAEGHAEGNARVRGGYVVEVINRR